MSAMLEEDAREMLEVGLELDSPEIVRRALIGGADPDSRDEKGITVLFRAIRAGSTRVSEVLLDSGANPYIPPRAMHMAIDRGRTEIIDLLFRRGYCLDLNRDAHVLLAQYRDLPCPERIYREGVRLFRHDNDEPVPPAPWSAYILKQALKREDRSALCILAQCPSVCEVLDEEGRDLLLKALLDRRKGAFRWLLEHRALGENKADKIALFRDAFNTRENWAVKKILKLGPELQQRDLDALLQDALREGGPTSMNALTAHGADMNDDCFTIALADDSTNLLFEPDVLHKRWRKRFRHVMDWCGADPEPGETLTRALLNLDVEAVREVLESGFSLTSPPLSMGCFMITACAESGGEESKRRECYRLLLAHGADPDASFGGEPVLLWAARRGYAGLARILKEGGADLSTFSKEDALMAERLVMSESRYLRHIENEKSVDRELLSRYPAFGFRDLYLIRRAALRGAFWDFCLACWWESDDLSLIQNPLIRTEREVSAKFFSFENMQVALWNADEESLRALGEFLSRHAGKGYIPLRGEDSLPHYITGLASNPEPDPDANPTWRGAVFETTERRDDVARFMAEAVRLSGRFARYNVDWETSPES